MNVRNTQHVRFGGGTSLGTLRVEALVSQNILSGTVHNTARLERAEILASPKTDGRLAADPLAIQDTQSTEARKLATVDGCVRGRIVGPPWLSSHYP